MKLRKLLSVILVGISSCVFSEVPYWRIDCNFENSDRQFDVEGRVLNTPIIRAYTYQGTNVFNPVGYNAYFSFAKDNNATQMVVTTGVVYSTYVDFQIASNTFAIPVKEWYASVMLTKPAVAGVHSIAYGTLTIKPAPEVNASGTFFYQRAINGDDYGPFTGSFDLWPFMLSGSSTGAFVTFGVFNASNSTIQSQIVANIVRIVSNETFQSNQTITNAYFETAKTNLQAQIVTATNRIYIVETGMVAKVDADYTNVLQQAIILTNHIANGDTNHLHLSTSEKAIATNPPSTNGLAHTNWVADFVAGQGFATNTPLYAEVYQGTLTGGTITAGSTSAVVITGPNAAFTYDTNAFASGTGSGFPLTSSVSMAGFTMSNGTFAGNLAGSTNLTGYVQTNDATYLSVLLSMTNYTEIPSSSNWWTYDTATRTLSGCGTNQGGGGTGAVTGVRSVDGTIVWTSSNGPLPDGSVEAYVTSRIGALGDSGQQMLSATGTNTVTYALTFASTPFLLVQTYTGATYQLTYQTISETVTGAAFIARNSEGLETNAGIKITWATAGALGTSAGTGPQGIQGIPGEKGDTGDSYAFGILSTNIYRGTWGNTVSGQVAILNSNTAPLQSYLSTSGSVANLLTNTAPLQSYLATSGSVAILLTNTAPLSDYLSTSGTVAILNTNTATKAQGDTADLALPKAYTNTFEVPNLQITGTSPTNGSPWIATNILGQGRWGKVCSFKTTVLTGGDGTWLYLTNATINTLSFTTEIYDYGGNFSVSLFTAPVHGLYRFVVHILTGWPNWEKSLSLNINISKGDGTVLETSRFYAPLSAVNPDFYCHTAVELTNGATVKAAGFGSTGSTNLFHCPSAIFQGVLEQELP